MTTQETCSHKIPRQHGYSLIAREFASFPKCNYANTGTINSLANIDIPDSYFYSCSASMDIIGTMSLTMTFESNAGWTYILYVHIGYLTCTHSNCCKCYTCTMCKYI